MSEAIFVPEGDTFVPTENACSPWSTQSLHGGSAAALLAHGIEQAKADPALIPARMTIDLFRAVPRAPLRLHTTPVRTGRRIQALTVSLLAEDTEVARATALLLLPTEISIGESATFLRDLPGNPNAIATTSLMPDEARLSTNPGLHTTVQARWVSEHPRGKGGRATAWLHFPLPFIAGRETTPLMRVAASSDLGNGIAHIRMDDGMGFINTDITLYLHREPDSDWICLDVASAAEPHGIGLIRGTVYDTAGPVGSLTEAILANPRPPGPAQGG